MTSPPEISPAASDWEEKGRGISQALDGRHAAVVIGQDSNAAAEVALGIGRMQARRRRVAIGDLVGELHALQKLIPEDVSHGLVDSFLYGVSLSKVAHAVDPAKNLYVMPSGAGPIDHAAILRNDRWAKLRAGFDEVDALLLVVVPPDAAGLRELIAATDGVVVVGEGMPDMPGNVLAVVPGDAAPPVDETPRDTLPQFSERRVERRSGPKVVEGAVVGDDVLAAAFGGRGSRAWGLVWIAVMLLAAAALLFGVWTRRSRNSTTPPSAASVASVDAQASTGDTLSSAPADSIALMLSSTDSSQAAAFSVQLALFSSLADANAQLDQEGLRTIGAVTYAPVVFPDNARWYRVMAGAMRDSAAADSLLKRLRAQKILNAASGAIVRAPFALLIETGVSAEAADALARAYRLKGLPVYALQQGDGSARLFAGAFESPDQAQLLLSTFLDTGERPPVVYRTGRPF